MSDYYAILEVRRDDSLETIKKSYKKFALEYHPDKNLSNVEEANKKFQMISEAYGVLSDVNKRKEYDLKLNRNSCYPKPPGQTQPRRDEPRRDEPRRDEPTSQPRAQPNPEDAFDINGNYTGTYPVPVYIFRHLNPFQRQQPGMNNQERISMTMESTTPDGFISYFTFPNNSPFLRPNTYAPRMNGPNRFGPNRFGPSRFGPSRFGPSRFGPNRFGPNRFGPSRFGPNRYSRSTYPLNMHARYRGAPPMSTPTPPSNNVDQTEKAPDEQPNTDLNNNNPERDE